MPAHKKPNYNTTAANEARRLSTSGRRYTKAIRFTLPEDLAYQWETMDKERRDALVEQMLYMSLAWRESTNFASVDKTHSPDPIRWRYRNINELPRSVIEFASKQLPSPYDEKYKEEWLADLASIPTPLTRLIFAINLIFSAGRLRSILTDREIREKG